MMYFNEFSELWSLISIVNVEGLSIEGITFGNLAVEVFSYGIA